MARPLPVIADTFRVVFNWSNTVMPGVTAHNVMHFSDVSADEDTVASNIYAHLQTGQWDSVTTTASIDSVTVTKLDGVSASVVHAFADAPKANGQGFGDIIPQASVVVSAYTSKRGRSYRGRIYLPWVPEGEQAAGVFADTTAQQTAWSFFLNQMGLTTTIPVVASYKLATADTIQRYVVRGKVRTQRRRQLQ